MYNYLASYTIVLDGYKDLLIKLNLTELLLAQVIP